VTVNCGISGEEQPEEKAFPWVSQRANRALREYFDGTRGLATECEEEMTRYGLELGESLVRVNAGQMNVVAEFRNAARSGEAGVSWCIDGSPEFQRVPWELLRCKTSGEDFIVALKHLFRRQVPRKGIHGGRIPTGDKLRVLWHTARPLMPRVADADRNPLPDAPYAEVRAALDNRAPIQRTRSGSLESLLDALRASGDGFHVLHLDLHGQVSSCRELHEMARAHPERWNLRDRSGLGPLPESDTKTGVLRFEEGGPEKRNVPVTASELAGLLANSNCAPLIALNACRAADVPEQGDQSALPGFLFEAGARAVVAFQHFVTVRAAQLFFTAFYKALAGDTDWAGNVDHAVRRGRAALWDDDLRWEDEDGEIRLKDWSLPVIYASEDLRLFGGTKDP